MGYFECMTERGFIACRASLTDPEDTHAVNEFRVVLFEPVRKLVFDVLGEGFKRFCFFAACFGGVDQFAATGEPLALLLLVLR